MAIGDVSDDNLTPPGWWSFVQPSPMQDPALAGIDPSIVAPTAPILPPEPPPPVPDPNATPPIVGESPAPNWSQVGLAPPEGTPPPEPQGANPNWAQVGLAPAAATPPLDAHDWAGAGLAPPPMPAAPGEAPLAAPRPAFGTMDPEAQDMVAKGAYYAQHPAEAVRDAATDALISQRDANAKRLKLATDHEKQMQSDYDAHVAMRAKQQKDTNLLMAQMRQVADMKPDPSLHQSVIGGIGTVLALAVGGAMSQYTGGRNLALEQYNKAIEAAYDASKASIANQWKGLSMQGDTLAANAQRESDDYREKAAFYMGMYQKGMDAIATEQQNYNPAGTIARQLGQSYQGMAAAQQKTYDEWEKTNRETMLKVYPLIQKDQEMAEKQREFDLERADKKAKAGAGAGKGAVNFGQVYATPNDIPDKSLIKQAFRLPQISGGGWVVATNEDARKSGQDLVRSYDQLNHDLQRMQEVSLERDGAKSKGGSIWKKWEDTQEQSYRELVTDAANQYGMIIHGRSPTKGVLEEVLKDMPELKAVWERGDTTKLLDMFRNDVDSRMTLDLHALGSNTKISSPRPHIEKPNINTIEAPLTAEPVLGDNGYAGLDPKNFGEQLDQMRQHYDENPTLGGEAAYGTAIDNVIAAQRKGIEGVQKKRAEWAKEKSSPESEKKIASATNEIRDRELFVKMAESDKAKGMRRASDAKSREAARDDLMKRGDEAQAAEERSGAGGRNQ